MWEAEGGRPGELGQLGAGGRPVSCHAGSRLRPQAAVAVSRGRTDAVRGRLCSGGAASALPTPSPCLQLLLLGRLCHHVWPVAATCGLTREPPSPDPSPCLGLGFPAWRQGCLRLGHVLLLKGLTPRAPASMQNWGPSDLGELLFRPRTVEDSRSCREPLRPGPAACGTPTSRTRPCESSGGQCKPWGGARLCRSLLRGLQG